MLHVLYQICIAHHRSCGSVAARHGSIRENRAMEVDTMLMRSGPFGETISA